MIFLFSLSASAQELFKDLLAPAGPARISLGYGTSIEPGMSGETVSNPERDQNFFLHFPVYQSGKNQVVAGWNWHSLHLSTDEHLASGAPVPNDLYSSQFSAAWKHHEDSERFWGVTASYGSASDHLFDSNRTSTLSVTALYSKSHDPFRRWIWFLNYSNNRIFLNNVPIPGFAYIYTPSKDFIAMLGLPFAFVRENLDERWSTEAFLGPYLGRASLNYSFIERSRLKTSQADLTFESLPQTFYRADRSDPDARLFIEQSKALLGYKQSLCAGADLHFYGGLAFGRRVDERTNFSYKSDSMIQLENRWIAGLDLETSLPEF
jgi:hypothetical protein